MQPVTPTIEAPARPKIRPLRRVLPYVFRYPVLVIAAIVSLTVAAGTTLGSIGDVTAQDWPQRPVTTLPGTLRTPVPATRPTMAQPHMPHMVAPTTPLPLPMANPAIRLR